MLPHRKLPFLLKYQLETLQSSNEPIDPLPLAGQFVFPDMTTEQILLWSASQEMFTKVFSALNEGADIVYPSESHEVVATFLRMVTDMPDLCQLIADCIETNEATQQAIADAIASSTVIQSAINQYLQDNGYGAGNNPPNTISPSSSSNNLLSEDYICDDAHLCGMARWIVQNLHDAMQQVLQQFETATNSYEFIATFVDNFEGLSYIGSLFEAATWAQDNLDEYYEVSYSTTVEDDLTCRLFCEFYYACEVSLDGIMSVYEDAFASVFTPPTAFETFEAMWDWFEALDYDGASSLAIVSASHWLILNMMRFDSAMGSLIDGFRSLQAMVATGEDETDTYCDSNCLCSGGWCYEIFPETDTYGVALINWGVQVGAGLQTEIKTDAFAANYTTIPNLTLNRYYSGLIFDLGETYLMSDLTIEIEYSYNGDLGANDALRLYTYTALTTPTGANLMYQLILSATGDNLVWTRPIDAAHNARYLYVDARCIPDGLIIHRVKLSDSVNPRPSGIPSSNC